MLHVRCPKCQTVLAVPDGRESLAPKPLPPHERRELARWRVWAADVRDAAGEHAGASEDVRERARVLCRVLDLLEAFARRPAGETAANLTEGLEESVALLTGQLLLQGVRPPC